MSKGFLLLTFFICVQAHSQSMDVDTLPQHRSKIERFNDCITLKLTQSTDMEKFAVLTSTRDIRLSPNVASVSGLSFSYRYIYLGVNYVPKFLPGNNDDVQKGKTKSGGFFASMNGKRWYNELSYTRTKGYYLENTGDFNPAWTPDKPYIQFPKLLFTQYQAITAFNGNPEYSIGAITYQTERQLKSAGSFIPQFRARYYINDDQSVPLPNGFTQKAKNLEFLVGAGYHYTFVARERFYLSLAATPNAGFIFSHIATRYATETIKGHQRNPVLRLDGRAGAGYSSRRFFAGAYMNVSAAVFTQQHTSVATENDKLAFQAFVGYRLEAPGWLIRTVDKVGKKIGMN